MVLDALRQRGRWQQTVLLLTALLARAPRLAHRYRNGDLETIAADDESLRRESVDAALADLQPGERVGLLPHAASTIPYLT